MSEWRCTLRKGRWQSALFGVTCDALITDPPYSERTIKGQRSNNPRDLARHGHFGEPVAAIGYAGLSHADVDHLVASWVPRTRRWFVMFGDHLTTRWALDALDAHGWYTFPPVPWVKPDAIPRIASDGPSPGAEFIAVARPRRVLSRVEKRFRRGYYAGNSRPGRVPGVVGAKPLWLLEAIIADYSEPGDVVADPYAGAGSTLRASRNLGRHSIGAEMDPDTHAKGLEVLRGAVPAEAMETT